LKTNASHKEVKKELALEKARIEKGLEKKRQYIEKVCITEREREREMT
jgi:hypothetical protein